MTSDLLQQKQQRLQEILKGYAQVAVAFSGGVDSSLLVKVATATLGPEKVLALFAKSQVQTEEEIAGAEAVARFIGCRFQMVDFDLFSCDGFRTNPPDRCYHCKHAILSAFLEITAREQIPFLLDGSNMDDLQEDRPGHRALHELGVLSPLVAAGLTKADIRLISKELHLPTWNKHSASCLATRLPVNKEITAEVLALVAQGEKILHDLGYPGCRLRLDNGTGYIELVSGDTARAAGQGDLAVIRKKLNLLGITKVFLDLSERQGILSSPNDVG